TVEQAQLIQQLEGLNLDTQTVLRNQEEAHTADTTSYQKLYNELSICYQALQSNQGRLRQSHVALTTQLGQKEQQIVQLQGWLQQQQQQQTHNQRQLPQTLAPAGPPARWTNSNHFEEHDSPDQEPSGEEDPASTCSPVPQEPPGAPDTPLALSPSRGQHTGRRQSAPVQRSRSLSPVSSVESGRGVEKRIHDLEELLRLKTDENEELRRAHEKRHERLRLVQTNYRTVKDQLREVEDAQGLPSGRAQQRAEPWQLRQENSDAVWNELAYFKHLNKKLTTHKTNLEEELDVLRVQAAIDRATVQELRLCLQNEQQELLHKVAANPEVKNSTPKKPSAERVEQSLKKIEQLERRTVSMEQETERLREDNQDLQEANTALTQDKEHLQGSLARLRTQGAARDKAAHAQALAQGERHRAKALALETQLEGGRREAGRTGSSCSSSGRSWAS
uniref:Centlein, centrosomal protein n=1 Tax=Hucho hucho TaxID=62062 RepID=A0A4W5JQQ1_9TELE